MAHRAEERDVREKLHLDRLVTLPGAGLASPRRRSSVEPRAPGLAHGPHVEREVPRREADSQGGRLGGEQRAHAVPRLRVRRRVASGRATEGRLVDEDRARQGAGPLQPLKGPGPCHGRVPERARDGAVEDVLRER